MDARTQFARTAADLVETDDSVALVYAEISGQFFGDVERRHPDRVLNVGIREQLLVNVGAGLALTGMRPIVHTFGSFLVERAFEQVKLGFGHQDVGGVLVGAGGSFDIVGGGRTHQSPGAWCVRPPVETSTEPPDPTSTPPTSWWSKPSLTCSKARSTRKDEKVCTIGRIPARASPAPTSTSSCSRMPTLTTRSGWRRSTAPKNCPEISA